MNDSFEDENICTEFIKNCAPEGWIANTFNGSYYFDDAPHAALGSHFVGLTFGKGSKRYFIRSPLLCALRPGASYEVSFLIRSNQSERDSVGVGFAQEDPLFNKAGIQNGAPSFYVSDAPQTKEQAAWQKISFIYTASGSERFIIIGDFKKTGHVLDGIPDMLNAFYFFLEGVEMHPLNTKEKLCAGAGSIREEAYEVNERHSLLEKKLYLYSRHPPAVTAPPLTILQRIDTLIIPDVLFTTNSYAISKEAHGLLDSLLSAMRSRTLDSVVVEGHTDSTGAVLLNVKLSRNRAASVANYLAAASNGPVFSRGWASEKPVADNRTSQGRQKNRRVEIYLYLRE